MKKRQFIAPAYLLLLLVMFILPYFSTAGYSIIANTTSELGAQNTPNAWIMNITFGLLGLACIIEGSIYLKSSRMHQFLLFLFGVSLILTALYHHAPIHQIMSYDIYEDKVHSVFASMVGFSFSLFSFSAIFIEETNSRRLIALSIGFLTTFLSILMGTLPAYAGIWQRLIFIVSFSWIIFFLKDKKTGYI